METLGLNITDLVILFIIGSSGIISLFRGFTKEFLSLLLWVFAFFAAVGLEGFVTPKISEIIGNEIFKNYSFSSYIYNIYHCWRIFNQFDFKLVKWSGMSGFDKFMGVLFGVSRGLIIILTIFFLLPSNLKESEIFISSKISPIFEQFLPVLESYIKKMVAESDIEDLISNGE